MLNEEPLYKFTFSLWNRAVLFLLPLYGAGFQFPAY